MAICSILFSMSKNILIHLQTKWYCHLVVPSLCIFSKLMILKCQFTCLLTVQTCVWFSELFIILNNYAYFLLPLPTLLYLVLKQFGSVGRSLCQNNQQVHNMMNYSFSISDTTANNLFMNIFHAILHQQNQKHSASESN